MKRIGKLTAALLVLALAACTSGGKHPMEPTTHTLMVHADLEDGVLTIHREPHDEPKLMPGDRLEWSCKCPTGAELTVRDIHHLAILDLLDDRLRDQVMEAARNSREMPAAAAAGEAAYAPGDPFLGPTERVGPTTILSPPYRRFDHGHLWKFTWQVSLEGYEDAIWDPHFSGGPSR